MFELTGKVAIVTGGSTGIGRAITLALAGRGAKVVVNYIVDPPVADALVAEVKATGTDALAVQGDVTNRDDVQRLIDTTLQTFGRIDILVNNAGITRDNLLMRMTDEEWDQVLTVNLRGAFLCTRAAIRTMLKQKWGRIICTSSVAGVAGNPGQANYAASKAALIGFTKAIAKEVAARNITANAIAPGLVETQLTKALTDTQTEAIRGLVPMGRIATPDEIAPAVVFLASDEAAYITGQVINIDGGLVM